ncbi:MAG: hypothetical protein JWL62_2074 [Hyphomicrobiales bacterium]|nr:hypothetical protein [Hyphomicrobiales bacterium]
MSLAQRISGFARDRRGNVALLTALMLVPIVIGVGGAVDYSRYVNTQNALNMASQAATMAAINTGRALFAANPGTITMEDVQAAALVQATNTFGAQVAAVAGLDYQLSGMSLTQTGNVLSAKASYSAALDTTVLKLVGVSTIPLAGASASNGPIVGDSTDPNYVVRETFERPESFGWFRNLNQWQSSRGVEIGTASLNYGTTAPQGTHIAELDGNVNVAMSKKTYLARGTYELRYWYTDRITIAGYAPAWLCGSKSSDITWSPGSDAAQGDLVQTNRIGVYLDVALTDVPPGYINSSSNNLIDVCASSGHKWVERSVKITITAPGYFWLTFQAEGASDTVGGLIDDIRICKDTCPGTVQENFPWTPNTVVFTDSFENYATFTDWGTLSASGINAGWTSQSTGWSIAPVNQMDFWYAYTGLGLELDAAANRSIHKRFLLDPGYYRIEYKYNVASPPVVPGFTSVNCGATPAAANYAALAAIPAVFTVWGSHDGGTNAVGLYMDANANYAAPVDPTNTVHENAVWYNPDGSADNGTYPHLPGQLLDFCTYSPNWITRTVNVRITKPGFYWLTLRAEGTDDMMGGMIDDVKLTALGGPSMSSPPYGAVTIAPGGLPAGTPIVMGAISVAAQ